MSENIFQGSLFPSDFLNDSITRLADWATIGEPALKMLESDLRKTYDRFPIKKTPNESQTEDDLIWPILARLGGPPVCGNQGPHSRRKAGSRYRHGPMRGASLVTKS